jgi:hypothetical protein
MRVRTFHLHSVIQFSSFWFCSIVLDRTTIHSFQFVILSPITMRPTIIFALASAMLSSAHTAAWAPGMYCRGRNTTTDDQNTYLAVNPLYDLPKSEWWFQHDRGCDLMPPATGEFLELPAGGSFTVELAHNRAQTTLSYDGQFVSDWPGGKDHRKTGMRARMRHAWMTVRCMRVI